MSITLRSRTTKGESLQAIFEPEKGMNLVSFKKDEIEVIDQTTRSLFEERYAGLGALIGPHFHHRKKEVLPKISNEALFPHIARVQAKGISEPFSHGIGRYAPWKAEATQDAVKAALTGKDLWNEVPLMALEGQNFTMNYEAKLYPTGLELRLSVVSETDSCVGTHFYYHLPQKSGKVTSRVQNYCLINGQKTSIPKEWNFDSQNLLTFDLNNEADYTFYPFPDVLEGQILLDAGDYQLKTRYACLNQENCWQLYHPQGSSYVCIEPISAADPRHPTLSVSSLKIHLEIL